MLTTTFMTPILGVTSQHFVVDQVIEAYVLSLNYIQTFLELLEGLEHEVPCSTHVLASSKFGDHLWAVKVYEQSLHENEL